MKSLWNDSDAQACEAAAGPDPADRALAQRVYTSRLLGKEPDLVLHGGGNTSVKVSRNDGSDERTVMHVKGSGWDLATIEAAGLPGVWLDPLIEARKAVSMSDEAMVALLRAELLDPSSPTPSVEALLHAYLPAKVVDHTHSAACLAIADQPDAAERCREIFGDELCVVPYVMPGFQLSQEADRIFRASGQGASGLFLVKHGLFAFGEDARTSYDRIIRYTNQCEDYLAARGASLPPQEENTAAADPTAHPSVAALSRVLTSRDRFAKGLHLDLRRSRAITAFLEMPDCEAVVSRGTITPDHVIRIKPRPAFGEAGFTAADWDRTIDDFVTWYGAYFQRHAPHADSPKTMLDPLPRVVMIRGLGLVGLGSTAKEARIAADLAEQTARVLPSAEAIGRFEPLTEAQLFEMEYWSLEQAKLKVA